MDIKLGAQQSPKDSATTLAYNKLRWLILTGDLAPGEKLKISALRDMLKTGASPVREALSLLVSDQLVVRHEQRGFSAAATSNTTGVPNIAGAKTALRTEAFMACIAA